VSRFLIVMLNDITLSVTFSHCYAECHNAEWHFDECSLLDVIMLSVTPQFMSKFSAH
jgi:hypothetical protein